MEVYSDQNNGGGLQLVSAEEIQLQQQELAAGHYHQQQLVNQHHQQTYHFINPLNQYNQHAGSSNSGLEQHQQQNQTQHHARVEPVHFGSALNYHHQQHHQQGPSRNQQPNRGSHGTAAASSSTSAAAAAVAAAAAAAAAGGASTGCGSGASVTHGHAPPTVGVAALGMPSYSHQALAVYHHHHYGSSAGFHHHHSHQHQAGAVASGAAVAANPAHHYHHHPSSMPSAYEAADQLAALASQQQHQQSQYYVNPHNISYQHPYQHQVALIDQSNHSTTNPVATYVSGPPYHQSAQHRSSSSLKTSQLIHGMSASEPLGPRALANRDPSSEDQPKSSCSSSSSRSLNYNNKKSTTSDSTTSMSSLVLVVGNAAKLRNNKAKNRKPRSLVTTLVGPRRKNASRESTSVLKQWLDRHLENPYPSKGEKMMLNSATKMNLTQISTWFANARRRMKKERRLEARLQQQQSRNDANNPITTTTSTPDTLINNSNPIVATSHPSQIDNRTRASSEQQASARLSSLIQQHRTRPLLPLQWAAHSVESHPSQVTGTAASTAKQANYGRAQVTQQQQFGPPHRQSSHSILSMNAHRLPIGMSVSFNHGPASKTKLSIGQQQQQQKPANTPPPSGHEPPAERKSESPPRISSSTATSCANKSYCQNPGDDETTSIISGERSLLRASE